MVTFRDPDNLPCNLVWGLDAPQSTQVGDAVPVFNYPTFKPRKGVFQRYQQGPSPVFKLGHFGLYVSHMNLAS